MSGLVDISREVSLEMAIYPNNPKVKFETVQRVGAGKNQLTRLELGTHTGTHIDAPSHIREGARGALIYPLKQLVGKCEVVDLSHLQSVIRAGDIPETESDRLLFKTVNSQGDPNVFDDDFVALDDSAAEECVRRGVKLVGLDALSIRKRGTVNQVHEILIDNKVVIIEGLWLADAKPGEYELLCLPLKMDTDGALARVVLKEL